MMEIMMIAIGVMVGTLMASCVMLGIVFNKRVLKWYTKYVVKISNEVAEELLDEEL